MAGESQHLDRAAAPPVSPGRPATNTVDRATSAPVSADSYSLTPAERALLRRLVDAPETASLLAAIEWLWRLFPAPSDRPHDERVHLTHSSALAFDPRELDAVELHGEPPTGATLTLSLFGLCGSATMLPHYLAEEADRDDERGAAARGLLDLFHHRLFTQLVRGLHAVDLARALRPDGSDDWSRRLLDFLGQDLATDRAIPPTLALRVAPVLASGVRSPAMLAAALRIVLADQLGRANVRVHPFTGQWMPIADSHWTRLGESASHLNDTALLGHEIYHPAGAAEIVIGPLLGDHYEIFTPGHLGHARIRELTDNFAPDPLRYDLILEIQDPAYPPGILGQRNLNQDLWLARSDTDGVLARMPVALHEPQEKSV